MSDDRSPQEKEVPQTAAEFSSRRSAPLDDERLMLRTLALNSTLPESGTDYNLPDEKAREVVQRSVKASQPGAKGAFYALVSLFRS